MIKSRIFLGLLIFSVLSLKVSRSSAQSGGIDALAGQFIKYLRSGSRERIVVVTDKAFYASGETIWFKAWCLDSLSNHLVYKGKNLFVDLVDDKDSAVAQLLINLDEKKPDGKMLLPESLKEGYYWLRAYTSQMLKDDTGRIFVKPVYVLNASKPDAHALAAEKTNTTEAAAVAPGVQFFPEGGSVISGTTAVYAFRSTGGPADLSGYVTDTRKDTVARFSSTTGMGKFSFDAFNPRKYVAHVKSKAGDQANPLPTIDQFGSQLSIVDQTDQMLHVRVSLGDSIYKKNPNFYLLGISRDSLCFAATGTGMFEVNIPKNSFPHGRAELLLFNEQDQLVSQRFFYNMASNDSCRLTAVEDKSNYEARDKVKVTLNLSSSDNHPIKALLSTSITDNRMIGNSENNGLSAVEDHLEQHYSPAEIDLLMMTQKNLYTSWKFGQEINPQAAPENLNLLDIQGMVVDKKDQPMQKYIVNLFSADKTIFKIDTTDKNGHFHIPMGDYEDGASFTLKITDLKGNGRQGKVILDKIDYPGFKTPLFLKKRFDQAEITAIHNYKIHRLQDSSFYARQSGLLKAVTVTGPKNQAPNYDASKRVSQFSDIITSDRLNNGDRNALLNSVENLAGFTHSGISSMSLGTGSIGIQPLVIVDGVQQSLSTDVKTFLQNYDPTNIDFVEVLKGPQAAAYGLYGAGGVILINTTNTKKDISQFNDQGLSTIYPKGYFRHSDFAAPDYTKKEVKQSSFPDMRSTLYWNPGVLTDNNGKASIDFFTADEPSVYSVTINGMSATGEIICRKVEIKKQ